MERLGWLVLLLLVGAGCAAQPVVARTESAADVRATRPVLVSTEPEPPADCTVRPEYPRGELAAASASDAPVVRVAIFLMRNDRCGSYCRDVLGCGTDSPDCWWTPDTVRELFGRGRGVDRILRPAVQVVVDRVFECRYRPSRFRQGSDDIFIPQPNPDDPEWTGRYADVNEHFGLDRRVNLIVWIQMSLPNELGVVYYATSPLRPTTARSRRLGAVWVDRSCAERTFPAGLCPRKLAHEIGHALGLVHVPPDRPAGPERAELDTCGSDETHDPDGRNLMTADGSAGQDTLTPAQICKMRRVAARHYR